MHIYMLINNALCTQAINYKKYSTASDVWSFGVLMYEIWSLGHRPFEDKSNHEVPKLNAECDRQFRIHTVIGY